METMGFIFGSTAISFAIIAIAKVVTLENKLKEKGILEEKT